MADKYLDESGLSYFWGKLKAYFQEKLVSGTNIKTINNQTLLGSGNMSISGGVSDVEVNGTSVVSGGVADVTVPTKTSDLNNDSGFITSSSVPSAETSNPAMDGTASPGSSTKWSRGDHVHPSDTSKQDTLVSGTNIKTVNSNSVIGSGNIAIKPDVVYCTCTTASGTSAKEATIVSGSLDSLVTGCQAIVKFSYANGVANPTLKIGGTTAKSIKRYGTTSPSTSAGTSWNAGSCVFFVYDGTYWQQVGFLNSTYSEISVANITNGSGSTTGTITGRRAKSAVEAFSPVKNVTVGGTSVMNGTTAEVPSIPTDTSDLNNDSGFITSNDIPMASDGNPVMDGTASPGTGSTWARGDHVHPSDTSRQEVLVSGTNIKTINNQSILGSGNIQISGGGSSPLIGSTNDYTPTQVYNAVTSGQGAIITHTDQTYGDIVADYFNVSIAMGVVISNVIGYNVLLSAYMLFTLVGDITTNAWSCTVTTLAQMSDIPNLVPARVAFTPTAGSSYSGYGGCYYETYGDYYGRVVHVHVGVSGLTQGSGQSIYTLPSEVRPHSMVVAHGTAGRADNIGYLEVRADGTVYVQPNGGTYIGADVTYIVD